MMLLKQLLALTPKKVGDRARQPRIITLDDTGSEEKQKGNYRRVITNTSLNNPDSTGDRYTLQVRNYGTKSNPKEFKFVPDSQIWCHCSCPYFTYYLEVVLTLHKSSEINNSNRRIPKVTNPKLRPYVCKHLFATILYLMNKDKGLKGNNLYMGIHRFKK